MDRPEALLFRVLWMFVPALAAVAGHYFLFLRQDLSARQTLGFAAAGLVAGVALCFVPIIKVVAPAVAVAPGVLYVVARERSWIAADRAYLQRKLAEIQAELKRAPASNYWHCEAARLCAELGDAARALYHAALAVQVARGETENSRSQACMYSVMRRAQRLGKVRCEVCGAELGLGTRICPSCHTDRGRIREAGDVAIFAAAELYGGQNAYQ